MNTRTITRLLPLAIASVLTAASASAQTATPAPKASGSAKSSLSSSDKKFVKDAGEAQLAILHFTELTRRPENPGGEELKKLNGKMGTDLNLAWGELGSAAKGTELPKTEPSASEKSTLEKLKKTDADKFDKLFLKSLTKETKKATQIFEMAAKSVQDADLKAFAAKWQPTVKTFHDDAERLEAEAGKKK